MLLTAYMMNLNCRILKRGSSVSIDDMGDPSFFDRMISDLRARCKYEHHKFIKYFYVLIYEFLVCTAVK